MRMPKAVRLRSDVVFIEVRVMGAFVISNGFLLSGAVWSPGYRLSVRFGHTFGNEIHLPLQ